jgi:hypothetical protein
MCAADGGVEQLRRHGAHPDLVRAEADVEDVFTGSRP